MLEKALIYLAAALIGVPIAKRLGLGSVLGYLLAGILIGPFLLGMVGDQTEVMHFSEFGVVMMLFLVGLELHPSRLWRLRHSIVGLGGLQVVVTTLLLFAVVHWAFQLRWEVALAIGAMLSLSSTAIVLQSLEEKGWLKLEAGQNSFSVLLFQDIAVIPMLALLPLLAFGPASTATDATHSLVEHWPAWAKVLASSGAILSIVIAGKYISMPIFRYIAETRMREIFTVFALFLVIAIALVMQTVGLSPALGTFLAGVVLAESEFRHELEADIEPFKGLLLGLFFVAVGASIDFALLAEHALVVIVCVAGLIALKAGVLLALAKIFDITQKQRLLFAIALAQGGEFAFVLLTMTKQLGIVSPAQASIITLIVAISMLVTPILLMLYEVYDRKRPATAPDYDALQNVHAARHVIIAGYGRFGQIIGRLLTAQGYDLSILDHSPSQIDLLRRFGNSKVYYGDAARKELLDAAGANEAQLLVIAIDNADKCLEIIRIAQKYYPNLKLVVRTRDRRHTYEVMKLNVDAFNRETFDSALHLGVDVLQLLGNSKKDAERAGRLFRNHDVESLKVLSQVWGDDQSYGIAVKQRMQDLKQVLEQDNVAEQQLGACSPPAPQTPKQ